ncbi:Uncharacterised protein [Mycobacteroides abscessus subsp. abscessus]|uniref:hypothetical protein n=1 Tax=Mycobacteroides abscessus TaxID=36809 RepID=UPI0009276217|nr:hypothetical protein [Mycobacteroides abscessus]SIM25062.1 Uncharacterised protein [Mycobacteroides abscessus subsp. abscessus]SLC79039.1 Uncharacterised protein [Mycobacteroides abscessus subsp. abscessus]
MTGDAFIAYWNRYSGAVWVEPESGGSTIHLGTEIFSKSVACGALVVNGFTIAKKVGLFGFKSTAWKRTQEQGISKLEVCLDRTTLAGVSVANHSRVPHATKEYPMSEEDTTSVTVVYPLPVGEPVTYPDCEIDELDSDGNLRIVRSRVNPDAEGFQYVVWRDGSFSRAETTREKRSETAEASIEVTRADV